MSFLELMISCMMTIFFAGNALDTIHLFIMAPVQIPFQNFFLETCGTPYAKDAHTKTPFKYLGGRRGYIVTTQSFTSRLIIPRYRADIHTG